METRRKLINCFFCEYCKSEFRSRDEAEEHERVCECNPNSTYINKIVIDMEQLGNKIKMAEIHNIIQKIIKESFENILIHNIYIKIKKTK